MQVAEATLLKQQKMSLSHFLILLLKISLLPYVKLKNSLR